MRLIDWTNPTLPWLWAPTMTFSSSVIDREQGEVLERAGDASLGDAVGGTASRSAPSNSTRPAVGS